MANGEANGSQAPSPGWFQNGGVLRYWDGTQWTEQTAPLPPTNMPPSASDPTVVLSAPGGGPYLIREDGKNGTVEVFDDRLVRTRKRVVGKDDIQTFPIKAITGISHDRKTLRTDEVKVTFGSVSYEWKVKDAEGFVADVQSRMFR